MPFWLIPALIAGAQAGGGILSGILGGKKSKPDQQLIKMLMDRMPGALDELKGATGLARDITQENRGWFNEMRQPVQNQVMGRLSGEIMNPAVRALGQHTMAQYEQPTPGPYQGELMELLRRRGVPGLYDPNFNRPT